MEICSVIEDYGLVGFETLAVEVGLRSPFDCFYSVTCLLTSPAKTLHSGQALHAQPYKGH
jgi:hypothetical protein